MSSGSNWLGLASAYFEARPELISAGAAAVLTLCVLCSWAILNMQLQRLARRLRACMRLMEHQIELASLLYKGLDNISKTATHVSNSDDDTLMKSVEITTAFQTY